MAHRVCKAGKIKDLTSAMRKLRLSNSKIGLLNNQQRFFSGFNQNQNNFRTDFSDKIKESFFGLKNFPKFKQEIKNKKFLEAMRIAQEHQEDAQKILPPEWLDQIEKFSKIAQSGKCKNLDELVATWLGSLVKDKSLSKKEASNIFRLSKEYQKQIKNTDENKKIYFTIGWLRDVVITKEKGILVLQSGLGTNFICILIYIALCHLSARKGGRLGIEVADVLMFPVKLVLMIALVFFPFYGTYYLWSVITGETNIIHDLKSLFAKDSKKESEE